MEMKIEMNQLLGTLVITSGSIKKSKQKGPAKSVYKGPLFRQIVSLCESKDYELKIISLIYGLIDSTTVINPYNPVSLEHPNLEDFRNKLGKEIEPLIPKYNKILVIAGEFYRQLLGPILDNEKFEIIHARNYGGFRAKVKELQNSSNGN